MRDTDQQKNNHLLWRAGFGPSTEQLKMLSAQSPKKTVKQLIKQSQEPASVFSIIDPALTSAMMDRQQVEKKERSGEEKKMLLQKNRESIQALNLKWLNEMVNGEAQLREKMSLFWHGHFACRSMNAFHQQALLNTIRANATGNFRELLHAVSHSAAMIQFLNNNQNRKNHPNENFAREVMELFTIGRGNYSEQDVKEAARAFTGWSTNPEGNFVFRKRQHDEGSKTFLGKSGNFTGDDILGILLDQKETAHFITRKMYAYFVNEIPDEKIVYSLSEKFYTSGYDIQALLQEIFSGDWFYENKNTGNRIKSPVELLVGVQRILPMEIGNQQALIALQRILGQMLLYPPNVAGWPGGKTWIDSSTLMMRMRLPQLIHNTDLLNVQPKDDDDQMMGRKDADETMNNKKVNAGLKKQELNAVINWKAYLQFFEKTAKENLIEIIGSVLLPTGKTMPETLIREYADVSGRNNFIQTVTLRIMGLPEYQLC